MTGKPEGTSCPDSGASTTSMSWPAWSSRIEFSDTCASDQRVNTADTGTATPRHAVDAVGRERRARARARRDQIRKARREWIVRAGESPAELPMWTSRDGWLTEVSGWLATDDGLGECARLHIRPERVLRAAVVLAAHADHATGRNCAVANATVAGGAGCSERTVTNARVVLGTSGLAVEIQRGTGSKTTPGYSRRPSVWHLISRPTLVSKDVAASGVCDLPPSRRDRRISLERSQSPSARERARGTKSGTRTNSPTRGRRFAPRPLQVQLLAADLVDRVRSLGHAHMGHICDALAESGLELSAWDGKTLQTVLDADMKARGWDWPNHVERPGAFLRSRLRLLPARPATATQAGVGIPRPARKSAEVDRAAAATRRSATARAQRCADITAVTTEAQRARVLRAHQVKFGWVADPVRAIAEAGRRATRLYPQLSLTEALSAWALDVLGDTSGSGGAEQLPAVTSLGDDLLVNLASGSCKCVGCGEPDAPMRPQLPFKAMSMVCDRCWPAIAAELDEAGAVDQERVA